MKAGSLPWAQSGSPSPDAVARGLAGVATTLMIGSVREFPDQQMRYRRDIDELAIRCTECKDEVDEFTAITKGWRYYSDGTSLLLVLPRVR